MADTARNRPSSSAASEKSPNTIASDLSARPPGAGNPCLRLFDRQGHAGRRSQSETWVPNSTARPGGMRKKSVGLVAFFIRKMNR